MSTMKSPATTAMGEAHDRACAELLGGRKTRSSGNQFNDQLDGKHDDGEFRFAWDGKSTFGKSLTVSLRSWDKIVEQAHGMRPLMPLRFYTDWRLTVGLDLVVCDMNDLCEMIERLRA